MSVSVKELMTPTPKTIGHDVSIEKAIASMRELKCHHLPVLDGGKLIGMISDRDLALVERVPNSAEIKVEELMGDDPIVVQPEDDLKTAINTMLENGVHSVVVSAREGQPWGILTATDVLKHFASN